MSLRSTSLTVEPGAAVTTELRVRNTGDVVDQFALQPLGEAASWMTVEPPVVRLFPDTDEVVTVTISPPRESSTKAGGNSWAVKAVPQEDPSGAAVAEGTLDVGAFADVTAELQPATGRGRLSGRFDVAVDNRGNVPVPVRFAGTDPDGALAFDFGPPGVETAPGTAHFAKLKVRPAARRWRGPATTHPFQVIVEPQPEPVDAVDAADDAVAADPSLPAPPPPPPAPSAPPSAVAPITINGTFLHESILPKWLLKAVLAAVALLVALFVLWQAFVKPRVESAARAIVVEELADVEERVDELADDVDDVSQQAEQAQGAADDASEAAAQAEETAQAAAEDGGGGGGGGGSGFQGVLDETSRPESLRLAVSADAGSSGTTDSTPIPAGTTLAVTDIILQNPGGAVGRIRVVLNGDTVLESALENFRDLDFHFVAPFVVQPGLTAAVEIDCATDQLVAGEPCDAAVTFSGFTTTLTDAGDE